MFGEFFSIIFRSIKLDKNLYKNDKNFTESAIYFSILIVILTLIIQIIPNNAYITWGNEIGLFQGKNQTIKFRTTIFWGLFFLVLKSLYFYSIEKYLFKNNHKKFTFVKVLTTVGFSQAPLIFNFLAYKLEYLFILFLTFGWYVASQTIALNEIFDYKSKLKSFIIVTSPIWLTLIFLLFYFSIK
mgnify:FL=1|tara:strand:+ start:31 stop:585 length:555 start_codon:yes stop_codon:yes gene_type:complete